MIKTLALACLLISLLSCQKNVTPKTYEWQAYDESERLAANTDHESQRMQYKLLQSKVLTDNRYGITSMPNSMDFLNQNTPVFTTWYMKKTSWRFSQR